MKPQEASGDCLTLDTRFNGVLDGQGHTIYNLYCDRCAAKRLPFQGRWLGVSRDGGIAPRKKVQSEFVRLHLFAGKIYVMCCRGGEQY